MDGRVPERISSQDPVTASVQEVTHHRIGEESAPVGEDQPVTGVVEQSVIDRTPGAASFGVGQHRGRETTAQSDAEKNLLDMAIMGLERFETGCCRDTLSQ